MNIKRIFWASVMGTVALFVLGYIMKNFLAGNFDLSIKSVVQIERDAQVIPAIFLADMLFALLITVVYSLLPEVPQLKKAVGIAAFFGLTIGLCIGLDYYANTYLLSISGVILTALTFSIRFALAGWIIAYFLSGKRA